MTDLGVHDEPIPAFTMVRSARSRCADPGVHDGPKSAASGNVRFVERAVAEESFDAAPLAAGGNARVELAARFARGRTGTPVLGKYGATTHDLGTSTETVGGGVRLRGANAGFEEGGEVLLRKALELGRARDFQGDDVGHSA